MLFETREQALQIEQEKFWELLPLATSSICFRCKLWQGRCTHWAEILEPIRQPDCLGFTEKEITP
jgi:hypothetical protein